MKKAFLTAIAFFLCFQYSYAQTAGDILERSIRVKEDKNIFLTFEKDKNGVMVSKYYTGKKFHDGTILGDSTIFLASKIIVYVKPVNPLNLSYKTDEKLILDPIDEAASEASKSIIKVIATATSPLPGPKVLANGKKIQSHLL